MNPTDDKRPHYAFALAMLGSPKEPSYSHPKILGRYFDHVYHQSRYIGQLTRKSRDKSTGHNQDVYNWELNEILSHFQEIGELNVVVPPRTPVPMSIVNLEVILPTAAYKAALGIKQGWMDNSWTSDGEIPWTYILDGCEVWVDWRAGEKDLERPRDVLDEINHKALYLQDYDDKVLELENLVELEDLVYDWLGATPASTTVSTDTEATTEMFGLSMGMPGTIYCCSPGKVKEGVTFQQWWITLQ